MLTREPPPPKRIVGVCISEAVAHVDVRKPGHGEKLHACVRHIFDRDGVPAFCEHVNEVMVRTLNLEGSSRELARVILKDVGLTSQILRIANSALYNRSGRPIMSVAHAITLLGWDTVRNMLSAIRFVEHFANASAGLRELLLLSVLNAVHSRDIAAAAGHPHPEEAYICGLLRNLGEVLVACHYPHEYSSIILAMHSGKIPARVACLRYLGFSWDDLGRLVSEAWSMPSKVSLCMRGREAPASSPAERSLLSITEYSHELTHSLYRRGDPIESFHLTYEPAAGGAKTLVAVRDVCRIVDSAVEETRETFSQLGIPTNRLLLGAQAERARQMLELTPVFTAAALDALDEAAAAARQRLDVGEFELTALITSLLNAVCAAGFDCAVFGLLNDNHTTVRARLVSGVDRASVFHRFHFPVDRADGPIRAALVRNTDVLVDRSRDDRYDQSALVTTLEPQAFALFPMVTGGRAVACLYAARAGASPGLHFVRAALCHVRDTIGDAIRSKTGVPAPN